MIRASGLSKVYPNGAVALEGLDLFVDRGEIAFIKGASGAGKTTLFKLILGMEDLSSGELSVDGCRMGQKHPGIIRSVRRRISVIFQDFRLIKGRTALENVEMGMRVLGLTGSRMRDAACAFLEQVGLSNKMNTYVEHLSWGEQQRVVTARALARKPCIILADEPTGNLDEDMTEKVMQLLLSAGNNGATVIVATHESDVLDRGYRVITLRNGTVVQDNPWPEGRGDTR